jgi:LmbE family N-acetylglucosaminyl deacetylase
MPRSTAEWEQVPARSGGRALPVAADVVRRWRRCGGTGPFRPPPRPGPGGARLLVIAPHPDDAALSVGGLLDVTRGCWERHVGTLVGVSAYQLHPGHADSDPAVVGPRRQAEERSFAAFAAVTLHQGAALDAPLRAPALGPFHAPGREHVAEFRAMVDDWVRELRPHLLLAPLGIGGHADHRAARLAACAVARSRRVELLLYEDLPYAAERMGWEGALPARTRGWTRRLLPIGEALPRKAAALAVYESQFELGPMQRLVADHAWNGRAWVERLWTRARRPPRAEAAGGLGLVEEPPS